MGQSLKKLNKGKDDDSQTKQAMEGIINEYYKKLLEMKSDEKDLDKRLGMANFYHEICAAVEELNKTVGAGIQFRLPSTKALQDAFDKQHQHHVGQNLSKEEFSEIIKDVIFKTGFVGKGAKDIFLYIFGVPVTALLLKQGVFPDAVSDDVFIPLVTSASVFLLAKMKKL